MYEHPCPSHSVYHMACKVGEAVYEVVEGEGERMGWSARRGIMECQARGQRFRTDSDALCVMPEEVLYQDFQCCEKKKRLFSAFRKKAQKVAKRTSLNSSSSAPSAAAAAFCASFALPPPGEKRL